MRDMSPPPVRRPHWLAVAAPSLSSLQKYWLFRPGALTAGLRRLGRVELEVLDEYAQGLPEDEAGSLARPPRTPVWVREIVMSVDGVDSVAARSLTPLSTSHGVWQGMRRLRTRPLADMLYHDSRVVRSPFAMARLQRPIPFHAVACRVLARQDARPSPGPLLARRSVFWRAGQPLLVAECFLPAFWRIATQA